MAIVVSDSSPIRALHHLGLLDLCQRLYGSVVIPPAVQQELLRPTTTCPAITISSNSGFEIRAPRSSPAKLGVPSDLDPGETEALAIAIELHADFLLVDERKATAAAHQLGLATVGVFGVLLEAKRRGIVQSVLPLVDRLVLELRFFASPALRKRIAELAKE